LFLNWSICFPIRECENNPVSCAGSSALLIFPDEQSCLEKDASLNKDIKRLDWREADTKLEATVCMFRLLGKFRGILNQMNGLLRRVSLFLNGNRKTAPDDRMDRKPLTRNSAVALRILPEGSTLNNTIYLQLNYNVFQCENYCEVYLSCQ